MAKKKKKKKALRKSSPKKGIASKKKAKTPIKKKAAKKKAAKKKVAGDKLKKTLEAVKKNCLRGANVPDDLKLLWKTQLAKDKQSPLEKARVQLVSKYDKYYFVGFTVPTGSNDPPEYVFDAWKRMFEQIDFIAKDDEGALIGLWRYKPKIKPDTAPVVVVDTEGQFHLRAKNLPDYFVQSPLWMYGDDLAADVAEMRQWFSERKIKTLRSPEAVSTSCKGLPHPQEIFDAIYDEERKATGVQDEPVTTESRTLFDAVGTDVVTGKIEEVRQLIANGADPNQQNEYLATPLHCASSWHRKIAITEALLDLGANPNAREDMGWTPLFYAVRGAGEAMIRLLVRRGADINAKGENRETPLFITAMNQSGADTAKLLIELGADVNAKDSEGQTALFSAAEQNNIEVVKVFLAAGAKVNLKSKDGDTALNVAKGDEMRELLKAAGGKSGY